MYGNILQEDEEEDYNDDDMIDYSSGSEAGDDQVTRITTKTVLIDIFSRKGQSTRWKLR